RRAPTSRRASGCARTTTRCRTWCRWAPSIAARREAAMGKPRGFLEIRRSKNAARPAAERVKDFGEYELPMPDAQLRDQAARCMDCGVPFCHDGCPLGNLIPEWNDLVMAGRFAEASASLHATNNFPEVTGRVCPAPCEASCVLNLEQQPVT